MTVAMQQAMTCITESDPVHSTPPATNNDNRYNSAYISAATELMNRLPHNKFPPVGFVYRQAGEAAAAYAAARSQNYMQQSERTPQYTSMLPAVHYISQPQYDPSQQQQPQ
uniref:Uncharacterized protein n=1 Tax=Lygus hesperus TaxID=30085 RepID=A0A0A9WVH4_LYGHE